MSHTLLIYETNPDGVDIYLIPNDVISPRWRELMREAHGRMINYDITNDGMAFLNAALSSTPEYVEEKWKDVACIFSPYKTDNVLIESKFSFDPMAPKWDVNITHVYKSGFVL